LTAPVIRNEEKSVLEPWSWKQNDTLHECVQLNAALFDAKIAQANAKFAQDGSRRRDASNVFMRSPKKLRLN